MHATEALTDGQSRFLAETSQRERRKLLAFIRRRRPQAEDAEDVFQDVLVEFAESLSLERVINSATGWMYRVARNKIADWFRRRRTESLDIRLAAAEQNEDARLDLENWLPDPVAGPEMEHARRVILGEIMLALADLPEEQRWVFWENEVEGRTFRELAAEAKVSLNTLLSRKRYAVLFLRERLQDLYDEMNGNSE